MSIGSHISEAKAKFNAIPDLPEDFSEFGQSQDTRKYLNSLFDYCSGLDQFLESRKEHHLYPWIHGEALAAVTVIEGQLAHFVNKEAFREGASSFLENVRKLYIALKNIFALLPDNILEYDRHLKSFEGSFSELDKYVKDVAKSFELTVSLEQSAKDASARIQQIQDAVDKTKSRIDSTSGGVDTILENAKKHFEEIKSKSTFAEEKKQALTQLEADFQKISVAISGRDKEFATLSQQLKATQDEIDRTLELANQAGLAGSFLLQVKSLRWSVGFWAFIFFVAVAGLAFFSYKEIYEVFKKETVISLEQIIVRIFIAGPLVWLGWFAARQYGFATRIRQLDFSPNLNQ